MMGMENRYEFRASAHNKRRRIRKLQKKKTNEKPHPPLSLPRQAAARIGRLLVIHFFLYLLQKYF